MARARNVLIALLVPLIGFCLPGRAAGTDRTWIGGDANWDTTNSHWSPMPEPDTDDHAIFSTSNTVSLAIASQTILELTLSDGIRLSTNGNDLTVNGLVVLSDASTDLIVGGSTSLLQADAITINSGADITLTGGQITVVEESGDGVLDVNNGGELSGNGTILFSDALSAVTQVFNLDGELSVHSTAPNDPLSLAAATLTITVADADGLIDLDGNDGVSTINVLRNDTLVLNGGVLDSAYSGTLNLASASTFSRNVAWSFDGTLHANATGNTFATIAGAAFTQTGGTIQVDANESLRFSSPFHASNGAIVNNGLMVFSNATTIDNSSQFQTGAQGSLEVHADVQVYDQGWDWDGDGGLDNRVTIGDQGTLHVHSLPDPTWSGEMHLNGGSLSVYDAWGQDGGVISIGGSTYSAFNVVGTGLVFAKSGGLLTIEPAGSLGIQTDTQWSGGTLNVDGELALFNTSTWMGGIAVSGNGAIYTEGTSIIAANTTINVATFDWDGFNIFQDNVHSINSGATLTLNIGNFDADSLDDTMDDPVNLGGNGAQLIINGPALWYMNDTLTTNTTGTGTATIGGTSRMILSGDMNVNGNTTVDAPLTFGSSSATHIASFAGLRLSGGDVTANPNRIAGGTISGGGLSFLRADAGSALHGYGTINTIVDFDGDSELRARDGTLTINGAIADVHVLGTANASGSLNVPAPWNTGGGITFVVMQGGSIQGGTITNDNPNGIDGHGVITAPVINDTRVDAQNGPFLRMATAGNNNDWDGATNTGSLNAESANLVLEDDTAFPFSGTVSAQTGYEVFASGFEMEFLPSATLHLAGGAFKSNAATHLRGMIVTQAGADSKIEIIAGQSLEFSATSSTVLDGNLRLNAASARIRAGAMFSGSEGLMVASGASLFPDDSAQVNVLVDNAGVLGVAGSGVGRVDLRDFQQQSSGELQVGLAGTGLGEFDRIVVSGGAQLGGDLSVSLEGGFVPLQVDTFGVLSALSLSGGFSDIPSGGRVNIAQGPVGSLQVHYGLGSPFGASQLVLSDFQPVAYGNGDYDGNGVYDCADIDSLVAVIAGGGNNQAYDLTTDNLVNGDDLTEWLGIAGAANLASGNPYVPGDANLDGSVDGSDFGIWNGNKFTNAAAWCRGDLNADGQVDGSDFGVWNSNKFSSSALTAAVPEPVVLGWLVVWSALMQVMGKRRHAVEGP